MGALKKRFSKAFAVVLSACLLLAYNPAAGTAFADEGAEAGAATPQALADGANDGGNHLDPNGSGQDELDAEVSDPDNLREWSGTPAEGTTAETIIQVSTFDSTLQTAQRDTFSATLEQLSQGSVRSGSETVDVSYIWYEVTGGTPNSSSSTDPYNASWQVFADGKLSTALTNWLTAPANAAIKCNVVDNVANYRLDVKTLAEASRASGVTNLLANDHEYTFVGTFTDSLGHSKALRVTMYTVQYGVVKYKWDLMAGAAGSALEGWEAEGWLSAGTELAGGEASVNSAARAAMENQAAMDTVEGAENTSWELGQVMQLTTSPTKLAGASGIDIPPFDDTDMEVRLPILDDYLQSSVNPAGYALGDTIKVLWAGDESGKLEAIDAKVVRGSDGKLKAEVVYPFSGAQDAAGMDETGWPALPGFFAIEYDVSRLPASLQSVHESQYFSVEVSVTGSGSVTPTEKKYWKIRKDGTTEDQLGVLEQAVYGFIPASLGTKPYRLTSLTLEQLDGNAVYTFLGGSPDQEAAAARAGSLSELRTTLHLTNSANVFSANSRWRLNASFFESELDDPNGHHSLTVKAKKLNADGSVVESGDFGGVMVFYYDADGNFMTEPADAQPASSVTVAAMLNSGQATVGMVPHGASDGTYYEVKAIEMGVAGSALEAQALTQPFVVPATDRDVVVEVTFGEADASSMEPTRYGIEAEVINPDLGSIERMTSDFYYENSTIATSITFKGAKESQYVDYVNVYVGSDDTPKRYKVNGEKEQTYTLQVPNYHADLRIEAYFNDKDAPSIELNLVTETLSSNGALISLTGGFVSPLGWTSSELVQSHQKCTLMIRENPGFALNGVKVEGSDGTSYDALDQVKGGTWAFVPVDDRENPDEPLVLTVTITFKQLKNDVGTGDGDGKRQHVNVYVADESLNDAANADLAYVFNPDASKFETDVEDADMAEEISVAGYSSAFGLVDGAASSLNTVEYGQSYTANLFGNTITSGSTSTRYGLEKVLVATYEYGTDSAGNQVKTGLKWTVYHSSVPVFILSSVTAHTDVIAYFKELPDDGSGDEGEEPGFTESDFVTVHVSTNVPNTVNRTGNIPVFKGSQLALTIPIETADHLLQSVVVTPQGGAEQDITETLRAAATASGSTSATYLLSGVTKNTTVQLTYRDKPEAERTRYLVSANALVSGESGAPAAADPASMPCLMTVGSGENYAQQNVIRNGQGNGIELYEGSNLRITMQRDYGHELMNMRFTWADEDVLAYVQTVEADDGSTRQVLCFTKDSAELTGKKPYISNASLYDREAGITPADARTEVWYVQNLVCPITVVPVYQKHESTSGSASEDYWQVVTKVGRGFGSVTTDAAGFTGNVTKVEKGSVSSSNPLTISFTPAANYRIADVHVSSTTGNAFADLWANVVGFVVGKSTEEQMRAEAVKNGYIKMNRVDRDYDITVDFEPIPNAVDPEGPLADQVAVNVVYDPERGSVVPNTGLMMQRTAKQQFTVTPAQVGDLFYSVVGVKVSVGSVTQEVRAIDKGDPLVSWGDEYFNTFVVDLAELALGDGDEAVTVEVLFSDTADTASDEGEGGSGGSGDVPPGTPAATDVKNVVVNVVADGNAVVGDAGLGGVVSPKGAFTLVPQTGADGEAYAQRVYVVPSADYEIDTMSVVRNTESEPAVAHTYMVDALAKGYFEVSATPVGTETITIYLKQKPLVERSYTISASATGVTGADGWLSPSGDVTLGTTSSQSYTIDPPAGYWVSAITDVWVDDEGATHELPAAADGTAQGAGWTRGEGDTTAVNSVRIDPVMVNGKVVDRQLTVTFQQNSSVDHGIPDADKVDIHVQGFGSGSEFLTFTPAENMAGVLKGTSADPVAYTYRYALSDAAVEQGYAIYRVQVNGADEFGAADNVSDLKTEGEFTFATANLTRDVNTLFVYVKQFERTSGGDTPVTPGTDDPSSLVTIDYGCGEGGTIVNKQVQRASDGSGIQDGTATMGTAAASGSVVNKTMTAAPGEPFTLLMTPDAGNVLEAVYLHNCYVIEYNWVAPGDDRTAKVALEYTMMARDESQPARVFASFTKGDANTFKPWDWTQVNDRDAYTTDGQFVVEITPATGVEALVEVSGGTPRAGDMLQVSNPVAPFAPQVAAKSASAGDGFAEGGDGSGSYSVTFDTISKVSDVPNVRIVVGPLIKWNDDDNESSTLYTLDGVSGLADGLTVVERPIGQVLNGARIANGAADGDDAGEAAVAEHKFYTYYEINGALDENNQQLLAAAAADGSGSSEAPVVRINLRKLELSDGEFPEYVGRVPAGQVQVSAQVTGGEGTLLPTSTTAAGSWFGANMIGPWNVAEGAAVSFKVEPAEGFVLSSLVYNGTDALSNGAYDVETGVLTFRATSTTTVYAEFAAEGDPASMRTITINVEGGHGTTSPAPGSYQVEKGQPYPIMFEPDTGYVPYRIWIDGVESYVSSSLTGWMLPSWWHDQEFTVQFALAGTTPSASDYSTQAGQNLLNKVGTTLAPTGDNPWISAAALLVVVCGLLLFGGMRLRRRHEAAARAAKYSVAGRAAELAEEATAEDAEDGEGANGEK